MLTARIVEGLLIALYHLSPYRWLDALFEYGERQSADGSAAAQRWRGRRYVLSELYIVGWLPLSVALWLGHALVPVWFVAPALMRVLGILQKELCVVLFGRCKVTPGRSRVRSSGRTIVLALINYTVVGFLFAFVYARGGTFLVAGTPSTLSTVEAFIQAFAIQFTLSAAFAADSNGSWLLITAQNAFCFLFGVIVLSLFVSLLTTRAEAD